MSNAVLLSSTNFCLSLGISSLCPHLKLIFILLFEDDELIVSKEGGGMNPSDGREGGDNRDGGSDKSPPELAESCLRELVGRVTYSRIGSVVRPLLV